ncbi:MAG TPA: GntR family transcriptional regulator [Thermomicrobiales bacterium]|jgi:DNA-binding GntR family transcriptional regulator
MKPPSVFDGGPTATERRGNEDLASRAYREIRQAIIDLSFQPGQQVQEVFLAQRLGTSRTPVREALKRLQAEGLIEGMSSRGAMVAQVSIDDVDNAYHVIEVIEGLASRLAAERLTDDGAAGIHACVERLDQAAQSGNLTAWAGVDAELHDEIRRCANNSKLDQVAHIVYPTIERVRNMYLLDGLEPNRLEIAMSRHRALGDAILARDGDRAEELARDLFSRAREDNLRLLRQWVAPLRRSF